MTTPSPEQVQGSEKQPSAAVENEHVAAQNMANEVLQYYQTHENTFSGFNSEFIGAQLTNKYNPQGNLDVDAAQSQAKEVQQILAQAKPGLTFELTDRGGTMGNEYFALTVGDNNTKITNNFDSPNYAKGDYIA